VALRENDDRLPRLHGAELQLALAQLGERGRADHRLPPLYDIALDEWRDHRPDWSGAAALYCELCGRLLPRRAWVVSVQGAGSSPATAGADRCIAPGGSAVDVRFPGPCVGCTEHRRQASAKIPSISTGIPN